MAKVFLSYDRDDQIVASAIAEALELAGHSVWWDRHIRGGLEFSKEIEEALARSDAIVVLWSANSIQSAWVRDEAATGRDSGRLVPATIDGSSPPLGFRQFQTIDLSSEPLRKGSAALRLLIDAIGGVDAGKSHQDLPPRSVRWPRAASRSSFLTRRTVGLGLAAIGAAGAAGYLLMPGQEPDSTPEVEALLAQAWTAWTQGSREGSNQAIGLYRRATALAPGHADAWGFLACAYGDLAHGSPSGERSALRERARAAGRRALEIDPKNAYGRAAIAYAQPILGNWLKIEREFRQAEADQPGKWLITYSIALLLTRVGRVSEAATMFARLKGNAPTATQYFFHTQSLWAGGQLDEADQLMEEAMAIFGTHPGIWVTRFDMLLYGGRPTAAIALAEDLLMRPSSMSDEDLEQPLAVARAMANGDPLLVRSVMGKERDEARKAASAAIDAIQRASALGHVDESFEFANAYYFSRGFAVPDRRSPPGSKTEISLESRDTRFLFLPPVRAMRSDARFSRLTEEIGLERYWREVGIQPDFRTGRRPLT